MDIYVGHSSSMDYKNGFYRVLRKSKLDRGHDIVLPHEENDEPFDSKEYLREECDLFVAEVSEASTGLGIEIGWADLYDVPIICVHQEGTDVSRSLSVVSDNVASYKNNKDLIDQIEELIE